MATQWNNTSRHDIQMVTGGWRSGASAYALKLAGDWERKTIIATPASQDDDVLEHIALYQKDLDDSFETIEESVRITEAVKNVDAGLCIIDDLATWVETIMRSRPSPVAETYPEIDEFLKMLRNPPCELIVVTREMNMGLPSDSIEVRRYRDVVGRMNQRIASLSSSVWLCVSGLPLKLK
ncbi:MAG: bifunctional adenosylcobinamide kinase/adenosylcobinamide-phosphate guanylyltransferase [Pyramidobacter sp.]|nr:bifunctional adenosylcobinamide kinase/adenosylcobinamide-phosphate guanylyltransferase [Pyramidobacter sp.]